MDLSIDPQMRPFLGSAPPGPSPAMRSLLMSLGGSDFIFISIFCFVMQ